MLDNILRAGSTFDWISPVVAYIQDLQNGPSIGYNVPEQAGWSALYIKSLLNNYGIKVWGVMIVGDTITFSVRKAQARFAQYLMDREGIPYQGGLKAAGENSTDRRVQAPQKTAASAPKRNWIDSLDARVDKLAKRLTLFSSR